MIRAFGILNNTIPTSHQFYGIPIPGEYLVAADGTVKSKYFEENYRDRFTGGQILVREFGSEAGAARTEIETDHLKLTAWASEGVVRGGNRFSLALDVELPEKMHVYAPGIEGGYIPIDWQLEEVSGVTRYDVAYPDSEMLHLPAIGETVPVYEGSFRLLTDVMIGQPQEIEHLLDGDDNLVLRAEFKYQACDDKVCFLPITVPVEWTLKFEQHDRERAPVAIRR